MQAYFEYLRQVLVAFFQNMGDWFKRRWYDPFAAWGGYFDQYHTYFSTNEGQFGFWGWFFFILFLILLVAFVGACLWGLGYLIAHYVKFYKKEVDKEKLQDEVEELQVELYNSEMTNRRILGLQMQVANPNGIPLNPQEASEQEGEAKKNNGVRFPRMDAVDKKYADPTAGKVVMEAADQQASLQDICQRFRNFACSQMKLYYTEDTIRVLFSSMATSKLIILEGISGTGKTSLPYCLGRFFKNPATIVSVQPSWHDRSELLGFYNDFTKRFSETDFLRAVYEAGYRNDPNLIVLDEMNLARIEYYFAEFLSVMEMPNPAQWNIDLISAPQKGDPAHLVDGKLHIEQNIWFIGTANNDDSTFTITDKVYDRALSLFFDNKGIPFEAPHTAPMPITYDYLNNLFLQAVNDYPLSGKTMDKFAELDDFVIAKFKLAFGNRILKQMATFVPVYVACGGTELEAVDYIFETKILKKFEVLNVAFLRDELLELDKKLTELFGKNEFKRSKARIQGFLKQVG